MHKRFPGALALAVLVLACAGEAGALVQRTFVSKFGLDTNPCTATDPCRTFAAAIAQTQPGGEVIALDSAGYGPVTITQSISLISPPGVYAGITTTTPGAAAIGIIAGASDVVVLKGLSLTGLGVGASGIAFTSGRALRVDGVTISGFVGHGINFTPEATARVSVTDTLIHDNGGEGILAEAPAAATARVVIERTRVNGNLDGVAAGDNSRVIVRDSVATGNGFAGFGAFSTTAVLNIENCLSADNGKGIASNGLVRVAGSTVTENEHGLWYLTIAGGIFSRGNNTVEGNTGFDGVFTSMFAAK